MFSDDKINKIQYFASMCRIANDCFSKCVEISTEPNDKLSNKEIHCLKSCAESYIRLRDFIHTQMLNDFESVKRKNKRIFEEET